MRKLFIETLRFSARMSAFLTEEDYTKLQKVLMKKPDCGMVMPGCGGMRKMRFADRRRGKGKRGGLRVLYVHIPETNWIYMVDIYDKGTQDDVDAARRKQLREISENCKKEAGL